MGRLLRMDVLSAEDHRHAETHLLRKAQQDCFPDELRLLKAKKPVLRSSRLCNLSPELDESSDLIRVGGRLRRSEDLDYTSLHPVVLDPSHPVTRLLIQDFVSLETPRARARLCRDPALLLDSARPRGSTSLPENVYRLPALEGETYCPSNV